MRKRNLYIGAIFLVLLVALFIGQSLLDKTTVAEGAVVMAPRFEVDPLWPKPLPNHWYIGMSIGVAVDAQDHVWIIHRPDTVSANEAAADQKTGDCCSKAPPVLEFDQTGNLIGHWGGPGQGYEWPESNHGITIDYKGNVWIGGNGRGMPPSGAAQGGGRGQVQGQPPDESQTGGALGYFHDSMIMKFTQDGKLLMQIGKPAA